MNGRADMDLSRPIASVFPGAHGSVLKVLARTHEPLSGRRVADLTDGTVGLTRTNTVLSELTAAGVVLCEHRPPAKFYRLNHDHVAAEGVIALTGLWSTLVERIRSDFASWGLAPRSACLFGSAARGDADSDSDIDILLVVDDRHMLTEADHVWQEQTSRLVERVRLWSGNECEVLEMTVAEVRDAALRDDRLVQDLRTDAVDLAGESVRELLRSQRVPR